ncbi:MAG: dihydrodipicolinate synthase family protein [Thermoguttaceae bacterium]|nr:dihydrodipicolinate synthase family protein [Thermoguttaceae bacterium]
MIDGRLSRRNFLGTLTAGALGVAASDSFTRNGDPRVFADEFATNAQREVIGDPRVRGPFPILSTPFLESGEVDYETLAKQAEFVASRDCSGMIWPQAGDAVDLLTMDEKLQGMEVLAATMKGRKTALCLGVQGKDIDEMLVYAKKAEELESTAIISRPPDDGKTEEDLAEYWRALMKVVNRPVIIQTSGGTKYKGPAPSLELLIQLGKESPYFGYVKEESAPIEARMQQLVAAKPDIKRVFSAMGGHAWLYQLRIGTEGLITERAPYADVLMAIWNNYESGNFVVAADAYSKLLLMLNMRQSIGGNELRGYSLYIWQKRGVFKNRLSREYGPGNSIPEKPIVSEFKLSEMQIAELDMRFEAMKPYLKTTEE